MHGVVVILGVRWIDGDKGYVPPVFAAVKRCGLGGVGLELRFAAEHGGNAVRMNCDQTDSTLAFE